MSGKVPNLTGCIEIKQDRFNVICFAYEEQHSFYQKSCLFIDSPDEFYGHDKEQLVSERLTLQEHGVTSSHCDVV